MGALALVAGTVGLGIFLASILFLAYFLYTLDYREAVGGSETAALLTNLALFLLWGLQHSVMARPFFKVWLARMVPPIFERPIYIVTSSVVLIFLCLYWQPLPGMVYDLRGVPGTLLTGLYVFGWVGYWYSNFAIDYWALSGIKQTYYFYKGKPMPPITFKESGIYGLVRHPIQLSFLIIFWATPRLSHSRLLLNILMTFYIFMAIDLEERKLLEAFGERYADYKRRVHMFLPWPRPSGRNLRG